MEVRHQAQPDDAATQDVAGLVPGASRRRQLLVATVVLVAFFALVVEPGISWRAWYNDWRNTAALGGDLQRIDGPLELRSQAATVALGDGRVLIWGGRSTTSESGAIYDPATGAWEDLPPAPGPSRFGAAAVWTGEEAVIWGGSTSGTFDFDPGGVAWDPVERTWRELPPAPVGLMGARAVAFPDGVLFAGGTQQSFAPDPVSLWLEDGTWTVVPAPLSVVNTAWDGKRLIGTGPGALTMGHQAMGHQGRTGWPVVAFDSERLAWEQVAGPLDTEWMAIAVADDGTLSAVTREQVYAPLRAYEWTGERWEKVAETRAGADGVVAIDVFSHPPVTVWTGERLLVGGEGGLTAWDPSARRFSTRSDRRFRTFGGAAVWTGSSVVALSGQSSEGWVWTPDSG